jgi:hypothetical protein
LRSTYPQRKATPRHSNAACRWTQASDGVSLALLSGARFGVIATFACADAGRLCINPDTAGRVDRSCGKNIFNRRDERAGQHVN